MLSSSIVAEFSQPLTGCIIKQVLDGSLIIDLVDGSFVVAFHAFGTAVVKVEDIKFGEIGVVEASLFDYVLEQVVIVEGGVVPHLVEDVVSTITGGACADNDSSLCSHGVSVFFVGDGDIKGVIPCWMEKRGGLGVYTSPFCSILVSS